MPDKMFRVHSPPEDCPSCIPWEMVEPFREAAQRNHGQTLEGLHRRSGLTVKELYAVFNELSLRAVFGLGNGISEDDALQDLLTRLEKKRGD